MTDSGGLRASDSIVITILDAADPQCLDLRPTALIVAPVDGAVFTGQGRDGIGPYVDLDLEGRAHDREDDDATLKTEWFASTDGKLGEGTRLTARVHMTEPADQKITLTFRVTDSDDKVAQDRVEVFFTVPG